MKDFSAWILTVSSILCQQVMCSSDYAVFHTSETGSSPDAAYHYGDNYNQKGDEQKPIDLAALKRISPAPKFTSSHLYISPEHAEPHFTRSGSKSNSGYTDGYSAFLQKNFGNNYDDDEEMNSNYRQINDDVEDEEGDNSKYRQAPKDDDNEDEHHSYSAYAYNGDEFDRIQSLPQKEEAQPKQSSKSCKIIVKGKAMCRLCKDPESGAHSESCAFSSAQPEKKYAYIKKAKYTSKR